LKFNKVVDQFPGSSYVRKSLASIGQTYYNQQKDEEALEVYLKIVNDYPTYDDTREALIGIQNIYTDRGEVEKYEALISSLDFVNISDMAWTASIMSLLKISISMASVKKLWQHLIST